MKNPLIVLTGPTASGKTAISFEIAEKYSCEIVCTDSMTVYRSMDIGTDKPTLLVQNPKNLKQKEDGSYTINGIKHHLIDIVDPDEEFNVAIFVEKVGNIVNDILSRGKTPMFVGGSLMYIDAYVYGYDFPSVEPDQDLRSKLETLANEELFAKLCELDPDCEWTVDKHNKRRLIRALEVCMKSGKPFSEQKNKKQLPENIIYLAVEKEREELYSKINKRVDEMFAEGFIEEVESLLPKYDHNTAMQAAGYKQILEFLDGKITKAEAIEKTKQVHRNYAKRQLTWLKKNPDVIWVKSASEACKAIDSKF